MGDGGLFRPVWMHITDKVYVPANVYSVVNNWGTYVAAQTATDASADVKILYACPKRKRGRRNRDPYHQDRGGRL